MNQPDLELFVSQVLALQAQRKASSLPQAEAELLTQVASAVRIHTSGSHLCIILQSFSIFKVLPHNTYGKSQ
ncbi:hypothetical protein [Scytonema sp. HK-05]|uniref:hypothetical protein n=1 Tax=Scytonema sp. HK-05 TaxID=1137095 RepID=UPI000B120AD3|nr:hypothetical protein [Scytonema sp. HK-05]